MKVSVAVFRQDRHRLPEVDQALAELDGLEALEREDVAFNLAVLWENFVEKFGSTGDITSRDSAEARSEHVTEMADLAKFMRRNAARNERYRHHYLAPALLVSYLQLFDSARDSSAAGLDAIVVSLIEEGRDARAHGRTNLFRRPEGLMRSKP